MNFSAVIKLFVFIISVVALLVLSAGSGSPLGGQNWGLLSLEIVIIAIILLYRDFEKSRTSAGEIAIIAVLGAIAAVGRLPFAALPNIQPTTFLVIVSGYVFGARTGFMVGSTAALVSNLFFGHGPWTPWQMFSWGLAGISGALLSMLLPGGQGKGMPVLQIAWGYFFGCIMNFWTWIAFIQPHNWQTFLATYAAGFTFDTFHAAGNWIFYIVLGPGVIKTLMRAKRKLDISRISTEIM